MTAITTPAQQRMLRTLARYERYDDPVNPFQDDPLYYGTRDGNEIRTLKALDAAGRIWLQRDVEDDDRWWAALLPLEIEAGA